MKHIFIIVSLIISQLTSYSQEVYGTVMYTSKSNFAETDEEIIIGASPDMTEVIKEMPAETGQTYILDFNESASYYKKYAVPVNEKKVDGIVMINMDEFNAEHYINIKEGTTVGQLTLFDETYIISGTPKNFEWKMGEETKMIQKYKCRKATGIIKGERLPDGVVTEDILITAWYAPEIKVKFGPENYWGLPGLILEVDNGTTIISCSKIDLHPKEKPLINPPSVGKKVTKDELLEILGNMLKQ